MGITEQHVNVELTKILKYISAQMAAPVIKVSQRLHSRIRKFYGNFNNFMCGLVVLNGKGPI